VPDLLRELRGLERRRGSSGRDRGRPSARNSRRSSKRGCRDRIALGDRPRPERYWPDGG